MNTAVVAAALLATSVSFARAAGSTEIEIKPGPMAMLADEKAITADVARGSQHGVILVEEVVRDDDRGTISQVSYHMRAKILSSEGRGLADIAIPVDRGPSDLKSWWGRTILADGRVVELPESALKAQSIVKSAAGDYQELRGALPGVVPGAVIDYGYVVSSEHVADSVRVFLQKEWPVRSIRYRWVPNHFLSAAYATYRAEGRAIQVVHDNKSVLVTGQNLDPVPEEPHMPPLDSARASATLYYTNGDKAAEYWDRAAKRIDGDLKLFLGGSGATRDAMMSAGIPAAAPLADKLKAAYDWLGANVKNTRLKSAEEEEADGEEKKDTYNARTVLKAKEASPRQLDYLFAGMARALGAEANIVYAVDRTDRFWSQAFKSMEQFDYTFVAVRAPGAPDADRVFVDAGSGVPYGQLPWRGTGAAGLQEKTFWLFAGATRDIDRVPLGKRKTAVQYPYPFALSYEVTVSGAATTNTVPTPVKAAGAGWSVESAIRREGDVFHGAWTAQLAATRFEPAAFPDLKQFWSAASKAAAPGLYLPN